MSARPKEVRIRPKSFACIDVRFEDGGVTVIGEYEIQEIDPNNYVQVSFELNAANRYGKNYTYIDPGFGLKVGDLVDVPTVYNEHNVAIVVALGDGYKGKAKREVTAVYQKVLISPDGGLGFDDRTLYREGRPKIGCGPEYGCFCDDQPCGCR